MRRLIVASTAVLLSACAGPSSPHEAVAIELHTTKIVAGQSFEGWLVVTNPGHAFDLTQVASIHVRSAGGRVIHCRPAFAVYLSNAKVTQTISFRDNCEAAPFLIRSGTTRLPFTLITTYGSCLQPGGRASIPTPACTAFGPPSLPKGTYTAKVEWSEHVPLPTASPFAVTLTS